MSPVSTSPLGTTSSVRGLTLTIRGDAAAAESEPGSDDRTVVLALSPSRAGDFMRCPLLFRFRALERRPERPSPAAVRGTLIHEVLDRLFDLPAEGRTLPAAIALLTPAWADLLTDRPDVACAVDPELAFPRPADEADPLAPDVTRQWLAKSEPLLVSYFGLEDPTRLEPAARELMIGVELPDDGPPLKGIVDRVDVSPTGLIRVVDYKTGKSPRPAFEQQAMFQMRFYALMLWRSNGEVPKRLQLLYLGDGRTITYDPTTEDLIPVEAKLRALWDAILLTLESGEWQPRPSRLCDWCDHQPSCPARGGIAPAPLAVEVSGHQAAG